MMIAWNFRVRLRKFLIDCDTSHSIEILSLDENELQLNDGRFKNFIQRVWWDENTVILNCTQKELWDLQKRSNVFNWISNNIISKWTVQVLLNCQKINNDDLPNYNSFWAPRTSVHYWTEAYSFSFKSETDKMYFALRWL